MSDLSADNQGNPVSHPIPVPASGPSRPLRGGRKLGIALFLVVLLTCGILLAQGASSDDRRPGGKGAYEASTILILNSRPATLVSVAGMQKEADAPDFQNFQRTQAALVKSRFVLNLALRQPGIAQLEAIKKLDDPLAWLEANIQVDFNESPEIMRVSLSGDKPKELVDLLEAVSRAYLDEAVNDELGQRVTRLQRLKDVASKYEDMIRAKRRTLKDLEEAIETQPRPFKEEVGRQLLSDYEREISRARISRIALQARINRLKASRKSDAGTKELVAKLEEQISDLSEKEKLFWEDGERIRSESKLPRKTSVDLESLKEEVKSWDAIAKQLKSVINYEDINLNTPPRVTRRQGETVTVRKK